MTEHRERISIRAAMPLDGPAILDMLADLASFEGADHHPRLDVTSLERDVFGSAPRLHIALAEQAAESGFMQSAGFISWFENYSSWEGRAGVHIGDLWVCPKFRGHGIASALLRHILSRHEGERIDVFVIRDNAGARAFYRHLGFREKMEWCLYRIEANE